MNVTKGSLHWEEQIIGDGVDPDRDLGSGLKLRSGFVAVKQHSSSSPVRLNSMNLAASFDAVSGATTLLLSFGDSAQKIGACAMTAGNTSEVCDMRLLGVGNSTAV